jgi:exodeoxyribonuclease V gamma subunit
MYLHGKEFGKSVYFKILNRGLANHTSPFQHFTMFYLHISNKTENLLRQLTEVLSLVENRDPLQPEFFLIQSQGMERMLSQRLSQHFVSWCNYEYMLPTRFFALLADRLDLEGGPEEYAREKLCWRLEEILRTVSKEDFTALQSYVSGEGSDMKRYQLAGQLAYVFDQYQIMRLSMVDGWEQNRLSSKNNRSAELYQMKLWNRLRADIGHSRHRGVFLRDLITLLRRKKNFETLLPERLSVFGLHSMPPVFLECLQALSSHVDVHFYLLSPCETYWADQLTAKTALRHGDLSKAGHPLLKSLGQQGREFQNMLLDVNISDEFKSFEDPAVLQNPDLLQQIQSDLLRGKLATDISIATTDESLAIVSAHSPHRELMILRDRILHWLELDATLELKDIVVMAPEIQSYSALIPALFHDIPHSIADRNPAFSNTCIAAFLQFLQLCGGRFGWAEVLELLERKEIYPRFEIAESDLSQIRHWIVSSGIRWGLSTEHKQAMGLPGRSECTWQSGLERLLMGYAVNTDEPVCGILPYAEIEGGMATPLGGLSFFCEILEQAQKDFAKDHSLLQWSDLFFNYIDKIFTVGSETTDNLVELYKIIADIGLEYGKLHTATVSFDVISAWVKSASSEKKSSSGFLRGQLTFCSMLPMRSIPFKKVCLLGLNDTVFPKNDVHPPFDLLGDQFLVGDRSRRSDDRYQFLEAILSARENLYISYVGQSIHNNDKIPPSVVVSELIELCELYGSGNLLEEHPLHGFSARYFTKSTNLFSYNAELAAVASVLQKTSVEASPWWYGSVQEMDPVQIPIEDLFSFYGHPQKYFVRKILGVYLDSGADDYEEHEPFVLDSLKSYLIDQDLVQRHASSRTELQKMQLTGQWPLGAPGDLQFAKKEEEQASFKALLHEYDAMGLCEDVFVDMEINSIRITGALSNLNADGSLLYRYSKLKGKDVLSAWLQHCLAAVILDKKSETKLLSKENELVFPADVGSMTDLETLLFYFVQGNRSPSALLSEPLFAYAEQRDKTEKSGKGDPMAKATSTYLHSMKNGYEAEWEMLHHGYDVEMILGADFMDFCDWFYTSVWKQAVIRPLEQR